MKNSAAVNPHAGHSTSIGSMCLASYLHRQLIAQMIKREVISRYKGSIFGLAWSFFNPVFMLLVYTFVFFEIFKSRWPDIGGANEKLQFAGMIFVGMIVLNLTSEILSRAPDLILSNANYVKKVVFPLEILTIVSVGGALLHCCISLCVLLAAFLVFNSHVPWTAIFIPLVLLPLAIVTLGISWMLASIGVFVRDVGQTITAVTSVLMFLSPVFYPINAVPANFRSFIMANPLTFIIEQARDVLILSRPPDWSGLGMYALIAILIAWIGYALFQKSRKAFADVL
jgi:lipopolysaccharide transport system permease protein